MAREAPHLIEAVAKLIVALVDYGAIRVTGRPIPRPFQQNTRFPRDW